jgi:hypothetical protein
LACFTGILYSVGIQPEYLLYSRQKDFPHVDDILIKNLPEWLEAAGILSADSLVLLADDTLIATSGTFEYIGNNLLASFGWLACGSAVES